MDGLEDEKDETTTEAEDTDTDTDTDDKAKETETEEDGEKSEPELPKKLQEQFDKRIGKVVAREKSKTEAAEARATAAEEKLKNAAFTDPVTGLPFPSDYVSAEEVQTLKKVAELKAAKKVLRPYRHEGYTEDGSGKTITAGEVEARLDEIEEEIEAILPKATTIRARAQEQFAADMKELRELRKQKAAGTPGKTPTAAPMKPAASKPPMAPGSGGSGGSGAAVRKTAAGADAGAFDPNGVHDKDSFKAQLRKAMGRKN
jgi:hypothetical protein